MCECESTMLCTRTCSSTGSACDSEPASRAMRSLMRRQVMRQSMLSPPNPPRTWIFIGGLSTILALRDEGGQGREQALALLESEAAALVKLRERRRHLRAELRAGAAPDLRRGHRRRERRAVGSVGGHRV